MTTTPDTLPRADVLAAVRAAWYEATQEKHGNPIIALTTVLRVLGMGEHVAVKDGRAVLVNEAVRTPETVLRAMLKSYGAAIIDAIRACEAEDDLRAYRHALALRRRERAIQDSLALVLSGQQRLNLLSLHNDEAGLIATDYAARLAGTRPLDAPPMEMP